MFVPNGPRTNPHRRREIRSYEGYNSFMRAIVAPEAGWYSYAGTGYANPHAVTQRRPKGRAAVALSHATSQTPPPAPIEAFARYGRRRRLQGPLRPQVRKSAAVSATSAPRVCLAEDRKNANFIPGQERSGESWLCEVVRIQRARSRFSNGRFHARARKTAAARKSSNHRLESRRLLWSRQSKTPIPAGRGRHSP